MVTIGGEIKGLKELAKNADKLKKTFETNAIRSATQAAAKPVVRRAKAQVPVDEGDLKKGIKSKRRKAKKGVAISDVGFDRQTAWHGRFVELGTSQQQAQPFLRPALEEAEKTGEINRAFTEKLNIAIAKALARVR